jgi:hypothetical protein
LVRVRGLFMRRAESSLFIMYVLDFSDRLLKWSKKDGF